VDKSPVSGTYTTGLFAVSASAMMALIWTCPEATLLFATGMLAVFGILVHRERTIVGSWWITADR
jgi:hypothetical protein